MMRCPADQNENRDCAQIRDDGEGEQSPALAEGDNSSDGSRVSPHLLEVTLARPRCVMSVRRVMGLETEYGVTQPGDPAANAMVMSGQVVNAYAQPLGHRVGKARWDYEDEAPLRDARGFEINRDLADPSQLTDTEDPTLANVILTNGARLYVDHAHPEYSSPEVTTPRDIVRWDKAGERVMLEAARRIAANPGLGDVNLYKNNTDNKGASYGTHENYLMRRSTPFADIVRHLTPFFVTRQVFCGAGRVGIGQDGRGDGFQISQRADFFEVEVGLETTLKRPIINTRDEPHADADRYRRLHVIIGDANLCEVATYLKVGTTALVLAMIEDRLRTGDLGGRAAGAGAARRLARPDAEAPGDPARRQQPDRGRAAVAYLEQARAYVEDRSAATPTTDRRDVLDRWEVRAEPARGRGPDAVRPRDRLGGQAALLEGFRERDGLAWDAARLQLIDLQYADVRPEKGLYHRLVAGWARSSGWSTTRRSTRPCTSRPRTPAPTSGAAAWPSYGEHVAAASWDSVIFDLPGRESLQRVPDAGPVPRHQGARRRPAGSLPDGRRAGRRPRRQ